MSLSGQKRATRERNVLQRWYNRRIGATAEDAVDEVDREKEDIEEAR